MNQAQKNKFPPCSSRQRGQEKQNDEWRKWIKGGPAERSYSTTTTATSMDGLMGKQREGPISRGGGRSAGSNEQRRGMPPSSPNQQQRRPRAYGRGYFVEQRGTGEGFRKADRPLVPESKAEIERWEPRVMNPGEMVTLAAQCIEVTDSLINLDTYMDTIKKFNPSNHDILRSQRMQNKPTGGEDPRKYMEQIKQCIANPGKFEGTLHCLRLVIGAEQLSKYIAENGWTVENLKAEYDITTVWQNEPWATTFGAAASINQSQLSMAAHVAVHKRSADPIPVYSIGSEHYLSR